MKKIVALFLLCSVLTAEAQHHGYYERRYYGNNTWGLVAPIIIGGVIGYELAKRPEPVIIQQPVLIAPTPAPIGYHWEQILDANCNCYRLVLVQG